MENLINKSKRAVALVMSALMLLTVLPASGGTYVTAAGEATATDAEETGTVSILAVDEEGEELSNESCDVSRLVYRIYTDAACTKEADETDGFVLSFNGRSYVDKSGQLVLYEKDDVITGSEAEITLPAGTYYLKQAASLWNEDGSLADTTVPENVKSTEVKTFTVSAGSTTVVRPTVKQAGKTAAAAATATDVTERKVSAVGVKEQAALLSAYSGFASASLAADDEYWYANGYYYKSGSYWVGNYHVSKNSSVENTDSTSPDKGPGNGTRVFCGTPALQGPASAVYKWIKYKRTVNTTPATVRVMSYFYDVLAKRSDYYSNFSNYVIQTAHALAYINGLKGGFKPSWWNDAMNREVYSTSEAKIYIGSDKAASSVSYKNSEIHRGNLVLKKRNGSVQTTKKNVQYTSEKTVSGASGGKNYYTIKVPSNVTLYVLKSGKNAWGSVGAGKTANLGVGDKFIFATALTTDATSKTSGKAKYEGWVTYKYSDPVYSKKNIKSAAPQIMYGSGTSTAYSVSISIPWDTVKMTMHKESSDSKVSAYNSNYDMTGIVYVVYEGGKEVTYAENGKIGANFILSWNGYTYADKNGNPLVFSSRTQYDNYEKKHGKDSIKRQYVEGLVPGRKYTLKERNALYTLSKGSLSKLSTKRSFELQDKIFTMGSSTTKVTAKDAPVKNTMTLIKQGIDSDGNLLTGDKAEKVKGAVYRVYWVGATKIQGGKSNPTKNYLVAKFKIQSDGRGKVLSVHKVKYGNMQFTAKGKDSYKLTNLPMGIYYIEESTTPENFENGESFFVDFTNPETAEKENSYKVTYKTYENTVNSDATVVAKDVSSLGDPLNIRIQKCDAVTGEAKAPGNASLAGAQFTVKYYKGDNKNGTIDLSSGTPTDTWVIEAKAVKNGAVARLNIADVIENGHTGSMESDETTGYYLIEDPGTITIEETKTPTGYNDASEGHIVTAAGTVTGTNKITLQAYKDTNGDIAIYSGGAVQSSADSATSIKVYTSLQDSYIKVYEPEKRYNLKFKKLNENGEPMANTAFLVTSVESGEKHVVVTDENGEFDSSKAYDTINANDEAYEKYLDDGTIPTYVSTGLCFSGAGEATSDLMADGSCWMGEFTIEEIEDQYLDQNSENKMIGRLYYTPDSVTMQVGDADTEEGAVIDFGTISNVRRPEIVSKASTVSGTQNVMAAENQSLTDVAECTYLKPETTYTVKSIAVDAETGSAFADADGSYLRAVKTFTTGSVEKGMASETVTLDFTADLTGCEGKTIVFYEYLLLGEDSEPIEVDSENGFIEPSAEAYDADISNTQQSIYVPELDTKVLVDETGTNIAPAEGRVNVTDTVTMSGLIEGNDYKLVGKIVVKNGDEAAATEFTAEKEFKAASAACSQSVVFKDIELSDYAGDTLVVYEELYLGDVLIGSHKVIDDEDQTFVVPKISTTAVDVTTGSNISVRGKTTIRDAVQYTNLPAGNEYEIETSFVFTETGEEVKNADGTVFTRTTKFTTEETDGSVTVDIPFDTEVLNPYRVTTTVMEVIRLNGAVIARHTDKDDENQQILHPLGKTVAVDADTGSHIIPEGEIVKVTDTVSCENMAACVEYTMKGIIMDAETGKALVVNGKEITAEKTFESENDSNPVVTMDFMIDTAGLAGRKLVVYEYCYQDGELVFEHAKLDDTDQTLTVGKMGTTLTDTESGLHMTQLTEKTTLTDTVSLVGLTTGEELTLKGVLMNSATGRAMLVAGKEVTAEKTFTVTAESMEVSLDFTFDGTKADIIHNDGCDDVVAFEYLYYGDKIVLEHTDIKDKNQTVYVPTGSTKAEDKVSGTQTAYPGENVTIVDHVSYKNLIPGLNYTITGTVIRKDTGKALGVSGSSKTISFTPETADGTVDVEFTFDASALAGEQIVIFEDCYQNKTEVFVHEDLTDDDQTITFPKAGTTATVNGDKYLTKGADNTVVDTITYEGLDTEETYTIKAQLVDKSTKEVVAASKSDFMPKGNERFADGSTSMKLTYYVPDSSQGSKQYVVFEYIYTKNGTLIAQHADINDEGQTVTVLYSPKTGDSFPYLPAAACGIAVIGVFGTLAVKKKRRR